MENEIKELLESMTLNEKAAFVSGADFWHTKEMVNLDLPRVMMCDGPHGLRKQNGEGDHLGINKSIETVCYPTASALASGFSTEVLEKLGETLGDECQAENVGMLLGPGLNMKRSPLCGRNFEYFSEDPYLAGKLASAYIGALQRKGIAACAKHFAANNQETLRMSGSSQVDERTLHEIYFPAFEMAVKEGKARSIMCAYNGINGIFCSENKWLLNDVLRKEWGFDGFVVTDWGAEKDVVKGIAAGLNLFMPGGNDTKSASILAAVENGELQETELDEAVAGLLKFVCDCKKLHRLDATVDRKKCARLSRQLSAECAVLLKNKDILPISKTAKVAFIGEFAELPRYQGSGSSFINVPHVSGAVEVAAELEIRISYAKGYQIKGTQDDAALLQEAVEAAKNAEIVVIFAGLTNEAETEGIDRANLDIPENQNILINAVAAVQPNTVVVLHGGAPMCLPWLDKVRAVLCMYLGGQEVGHAAVDLLYGEQNPSGKLAETWPLKLEDNPSYLNFPGVDGVVEYHEGIYIGYRYYDKKKMDVLFPFGYGLSYTDFVYSDLKLDKKTLTDKEMLTVTCKVRNVGSRAGKEAVQLYVRDVESSVGRPVRELKGFAKVELNAGEEKEVMFTLDKRSFAYYEPKIHGWFVESGRFLVEIGASSRDIRLEASVDVLGTVELPFHYTMLSPMGSLKRTAKGREFMRQMAQSVPDTQQMNPDELGEGSAKMMESMMEEMPLATLMSFGGMSKEQLEDIVQMLNS